MSFRALTLSVFAGAAAAQQTAVIPSQYATVEAPGLEQEPLAYNRVRHVQYVDRSLLLAIPVSAQVTRLDYRRDTNGYTAAQMLRSGRPVPDPIWRLRLGNTAEPALNPSPIFPIPTAPGWTMVYTPKTTVFPTCNLPGGAGPANWDITLPFDVPFVYSGGNIGIEHYAFESNSTVYTYYVDAIGVQPSAGNAQLLTPTSLGCPLGENRSVGFAPNPGGVLQLFLFGAPPSTVAFVNLGFDSTSWLGNPLPLSLVVLGAPTCWLYISPVSSLLVPVDGGGMASYFMTVPNNAIYSGFNLLSQFAVLDDRINPAFPITSSDALQFTIGAVPGGYPIPMSVVSAVNLNASATNGYVGLGRGCVFRLHY